MEKIGIGNYLEKFAQTQPNKIAIYFNEQQITYDDFYENVKKYKHTLRKTTNAKEPQKVALLISNEPAFLEVYFAIISLGWIAIPFDPKWSKREAELIMKTANADIVVASKNFVKIANYHFQATFLVENISATDIQIENINFSIDLDTPFYLGFTSGSTGHPKGFIRSHRSWLSSFGAGEAAFHYGKDDIVMAPGPLCHSLSLFGATHALHIGASFYLTTSFSAQTTFDMIQSGKATVVYAVPTMLSGMARQKAEAQQKVTFLSSGAKLLPPIKRNLKTVFPKSDIYEYYGASELSFVTYATDEMTEKFPNSVGTPFPGVHLSIRDDKGKLLPHGEIGHIYIESEFLFTGYVNDADTTKKVLTKYGATIGDLGFLNDESFLTIVGRENNMIISGGQNIYPEEVEKIMKELEIVKEAVIIAVDDEHWGQSVIALIQWKENKNDNMKRLKAYCRKNIAIYKRPRKYYSVENLPYTPTGKIARKEIEANVTRWMK